MKLYFSHLSLPYHSLAWCRECVLVVGTTGSGKSSTVAKYTGQPVKVGDRPESVTRFCQLYPGKARSTPRTIPQVLASMVV